MDALSASSEIGLEHRDTFKSALAATLVKESRDLPTFDRIFDLYFLDLEALGAGLKKALGPEDPRIQQMLDQLMAQENMEMDELTELMLQGEGSDMEMAIRGQGQGAGLERSSRGASTTSSTGRRSSAISLASCSSSRPRAWILACWRGSATTSICASKPSGA